MPFAHTFTVHLCTIYIFTFHLLGTSPFTHHLQIIYSSFTDLLTIYLLFTHRSPVTCPETRPLLVIFLIFFLITDNCFKDNDILDRWEKTKSMAQSHGIKVLGFSSDGDPKCLKAMKMYSRLGEKSFWPWFHMNLAEGGNCVQGTVHIGTKLRCRLLNDRPMPIGEYFVTKEHLEKIINSVPKDQHLLSMGDINGTDKMNFAAVEKITASCVTGCLRNHVENCQATIIYIKIIRNVLDAYLNKSLKVCDRIHKIWYAVFFLRLWRNWLDDQPAHSITRNFISLNAYICKKR